MFWIVVERERGIDEEMFVYVNKEKGYIFVIENRYCIPKTFSLCLYVYLFVLSYDSNDTVPAADTLLDIGPCCRMPLFRSIDYQPK